MGRFLHDSIALPFYGFSPTDFLNLAREFSSACFDGREPINGKDVRCQTNNPISF